MLDNNLGDLPVGSQVSKSARSLHTRRAHRSNSLGSDTNVIFPDKKSDHKNLKGRIHRDKEEMSIENLKNVTQDLWASLYNKDSTEAILKLIDLSHSQNLQYISPEEVIKLQTFCKENDLKSVEDSLSLFLVPEKKPHRTITITSKTSNENRRLKFSLESVNISFDDESSSMGEMKELTPVGKYFMQHVKTVFKKGGNSTYLIYIYPFIMDTSIFFQSLANFPKKYNKMILDLLKDFPLQGFPTGVQKLIDANQELNSLLEKVEGNIPALKLNYLKMLSLQASQNAEYRYEIKKSLNYSLLDLSSPEQIAEALSERDISLIQNISYSELKAWVFSETNASKTIKLVASLHKRTVNWFAYRIVSEENIQERSELYNKFVEIGEFLIQKGNFHTAQQISQALCHPAVERLIDPKEINLSKKIYLLNNADNNWQSYNHLFTSFSDPSKSLPIIPIIYQKLFLAYSSLSETSEDNFSNVLAEIAWCVEKFFNYKNITLKSEFWIEKNRLLMDLCNFPEIDEDVIFEYSNIWLNWDCISRPRLFPNDLKDWKASHLAKLFDKGDGDSQHMRILFENKIHSGKDMIKLMDKNPKKITNFNLPLDKLESLLCMYAQHLCKARQVKIK